MLPTDTVVRDRADAFDVDAVARLLAAKGRSRRTPVPVMVPSPTHPGRPVRPRERGRDRARRGLLAGRRSPWWPELRPSLAWDLGDTAGTVSVRMPLHPVALELLRPDRAAGGHGREPTGARGTGRRPTRPSSRSGEHAARGGARRRPEPRPGRQHHRRPDRRGSPARARGGHRRRPRCASVVPDLEVLRVTGGTPSTACSSCAPATSAGRRWASGSCVTSCVERAVRPRRHRRSTSAGTYPGHAGEPMQPGAAAVMGERGIEHDDFRPRRSPRTSCARHDLDPDRRALAPRRRGAASTPAACDRTFTLRRVRSAVDALDHDAAVGRRSQGATRLADAGRRARRTRTSSPPPVRRSDDIDDPYALPVERVPALRRADRCRTRATVVRADRPPCGRRLRDTAATRTEESA